MIAYVFKSSLSLILLFGLYWFLLRKEKLFIFNRFFLVLSVAFSLILPFISIPINFQPTQELKNIIPSPGYIIPEISSSENTVSQNINIKPSSVEIHPSGIDIRVVLVILYISGSILFLLRFLKNIYYMYRQIKLSEKIRFEGYRLVLTNEKPNPYCFFNNIFLNRNEYLNGRIDNDILNHELMHITQYHSVDIIFLELIKIFYWFNPVYLLYDRAIRINHEYLADHGVIHDDCDIKNYSDKLLSFIIRRSNIPLASGSNHSFTKKRLLMLSKTKSRNSVYGFRISITLSLILLFSLFLSFRQSNIQPSNKETDSSGLTRLQTQILKDIDGNVYKTVTIGTQVWMAENLKTTRYNDGKDIRMVTDSTEWQQYDQAFCWYNNKTENKNEYGALYNWYAVNTNKLCPVGWHVPNKKELASSINLFDTITGGKLKEAGSIHWKIPNKGATNESGFTALPGGIRTMDGEYIRLGEQAWWWTSGEENEYIGSIWTLQYNNSLSGLWPPSKRTGCSVRCIKDYSENTFNSSFKNGEILQNTVKGIVLTEDGKPLINATITAIGPNNTSIETLAFPDGLFNMNDIQPGAQLTVACQGFKTQIFKANFSSIMTVKMVRDPDYKRKVILTEIQTVNFRNSDFTPANTLVVVNGEILDKNGELKINPSDIKSLKVLMDKEATIKYGDKGKDGVLEIILFGYKTAGTKQAVSKNTDSDSSKYNTHFSINHTSNKGELIDIPVPNIQYANIWTYHDTEKDNKKELRTIAIVTRDYFRVIGKVVGDNEKPLPGVKISASDNPTIVTSDKEGGFVIDDVKEGALLEFSSPGYKTYYLSTLYEVAFNENLTIELKKEGTPEKEEAYETAEKMPQYPGGEMELLKFIAMNTQYPEVAKLDKAEGRVIIRFIVNTQGNVEHPTVYKSVHYALDNEALRVVSLLKGFTPGSQEGKPISVYYNLPITFVLPKMNSSK